MLASETLTVELLAPFRDAGQLFVVLDACDAPSVPVLCEGVGPTRAVSLYRGDAEERYADIAPYLLHVTDETLFEWVMAYAVTPGWGILVIAPVAFEAMRTHLRKFLKVMGPDGRRLYFRFYDPRVLPVFLPTCERAQLDQFFGPVLAYGTSDGEGSATTYRRIGAPTVAAASARLAAEQQRAATAEVHGA
ncbi:MAG: DUF4123 domain-containing protein [Gemmatimonadaceae bacterium]|nr:DUF4123 domain-containing protein [Gemmatimonadaceae bacterium]